MASLCGAHRPQTLPCPDWVGWLQEEEGPTRDELGHRDPSGMYSAEQPFWATVSDARYLTTEQSGDRKVLTGQAVVAARTQATAVCRAAAGLACWPGLEGGCSCRQQFLGSIDMRARCCMAAEGLRASKRACSSAWPLQRTASAGAAS